jgi:hypothetical protein
MTAGPSLLVQEKDFGSWGNYDITRRNVKIIVERLKK